MSGSFEESISREDKESEGSSEDYGTISNYDLSGVNPSKTTSIDLSSSESREDTVESSYKVSDNTSKPPKCGGTRANFEGSELYLAKTIYFMMWLD